MAGGYGGWAGSSECERAPAHKYGGWRDNLLCTTVALADGRVIRAGRPVVKNVAGYDLPKVFVGSQGTLGLLCDVTLKLSPLPRQRRTVTVRVKDTNCRRWPGRKRRLGSG